MNGAEVAKRSWNVESGRTTHSNIESGWTRVAEIAQIRIFFNSLQHFQA